MSDRERDSGSAADRHSRVTELFLQACELPAAKRPTFLAKVCGDDAALKAEIETLLAQDDSAEGRGFLATPAATIAAAGGSGEREPTRPGAKTDTLPFAAELPGAATRRRVAWVVMLAAAVVSVLLLPWPASDDADQSLERRIEQARSLQSVGDLREAQAQLRGVLRDQIRLCGESSPATRSTASQLAVVLAARNYADDARELREAIAGLDAER